MGCIICSRNNVMSGLILPEQEMMINLIELDHPFSSKDTNLLFRTFSQEGRSGGVTDIKFLQWCSSMNIEIARFTDPSDKFTRFLDLIRQPSNLIDIHQLLILSILLGKGTFSSKIRRLLSLYVLPSNEISQTGLTCMLEELVYASTVTMPSIGLDDVSEEFIGFYVNKIRAAETALVAKVLDAFQGNRLISSEDFFQIFQERPELQKICWPNGVRMMLIEEDINNVREKSFVDDEFTFDKSTSVRRSHFSLSELHIRDKSTNSPVPTRTDAEMMEAHSGSCSCLNVCNTSARQ